MNGLIIRDVTLRRSPWWTVHILASKNVLVDNIYIDAEIDFLSSVYPTDNVDGIDVSSSQDVTIRNSEIKAGDDCVVVYALVRQLCHGLQYQFQSPSVRCPTPLPPCCPPTFDPLVPVPSPWV